MAFVRITSAARQSTNGNGFTTASFDSTGGNTVIVVLNQTTSGTGAVTDNKGNTYAELTPISFGQKTSIWYAQNATCGTGHTITVSGTGNFPALWYGVFSGGLTSGLFNKEAPGPGIANSTTTVQPGSTTPDQNDSLLVAGLGISNGDTASINGGFSTPDQLTVAGGAAYGVAGSYLIQTTAAAANPTWTWATGDNRQAPMAVFKPAAVGSSSVSPSVSPSASVSPSSSASASVSPTP
ncbi:MAG TPA: hypothetical protein VJ777_28425, partial [Mycobacterium sp.]|nr:hypothetical protein [Mycobacterium sp.]